MPPAQQFLHRNAGLTVQYLKSTFVQASVTIWGMGPSVICLTTSSSSSVESQIGEPSHAAVRVSALPCVAARMAFKGSAQLQFGRIMKLIGILTDRLPAFKLTDTCISQMPMSCSAAVSLFLNTHIFVQEP